MKPARLVGRTAPSVWSWRARWGSTGSPACRRSRWLGGNEVVRPRKTAPAVSVGAAELVVDRPGRVRPLAVRSQCAGLLRLGLEMIDGSGAFTLPTETSPLQRLGPGSGSP